MELIANLVYCAFGACAIAGLGAIAFFWDRMRRELNSALSAEQKFTFYPPLPHIFRGFLSKPDDLGHFMTVLDQYGKTYPSSPLPKKVAIGVVIWILCFMALLAGGIGR